LDSSQGEDGRVVGLRESEERCVNGALAVVARQSEPAMRCSRAGSSSCISLAVEDPHSPRRCLAGGRRLLHRGARSLGQAAPRLACWRCLPSRPSSYECSTIKLDRRRARRTSRSERRRRAREARTDREQVSFPLFPRHLALQCRPLQFPVQPNQHRPATRYGQSPSRTTTTLARPSFAPSSTIPSQSLGEPRSCRL